MQSTLSWCLFRYLIAPLRVDALSNILFYIVQCATCDAVVYFSVTFGHISGFLFCAVSRCLSSGYGHSMLFMVCTQISDIFYIMPWRRFVSSSDIWVHILHCDIDRLLMVCRFTRCIKILTSLNLLTLSSKFLRRLTRSIITHSFMHNLTRTHWFYAMY